MEKLLASSGRCTRREVYSECTATVQRDYRFDEALHQFAWSLAGPSNDQVQPSIDSVPQSHSVPLYLSRPGPAVQQESSILHPLGQRAVTSELSSCFSLSSQSVKIQDEPTHPDLDRLQQFLCFVTLSEEVPCFGIFVGTQRRF